MDVKKPTFKVVTDRIDTSIGQWVEDYQLAHVSTFAEAATKAEEACQRVDRRNVRIEMVVNCMTIVHSERDVERVIAALQDV